MMRKVKQLFGMLNGTLKGECISSSYTCTYMNDIVQFCMAYVF